MTLYSLQYQRQYASLGQLLGSTGFYLEDTRNEFHSLQLHEVLAEENYRYFQHTQ